MKKLVLFLLPSMLLVSSCGTLAVVSGGEVLEALTKVTDSKEPCCQPFGGDDGKNLFYSGRVMGNIGIFTLKKMPFLRLLGKKQVAKTITHLQLIQV